MRRAMLLGVVAGLIGILLATGSTLGSSQHGCGTASVRWQPGYTHLNFTMTYDPCESGWDGCSIILERNPFVGYGVDWFVIVDDVLSSPPAFLVAVGGGSYTNLPAYGFSLNYMTKEGVSIDIPREYNGITLIEPGDEIYAVMHCSRGTAPSCWCSGVSFYPDLLVPPIPRIPRIPRSLAPAGVVEYLDRGWPEGTEPPEVGVLVVSAVYEIGEVITGCCTVEDPLGQSVQVPYVSMFIYRATSGEAFDDREPLEVRLLYHNAETESYCFDIPTSELEPGYYDIRLSLPAEDHQWIRVEVVTPAE